jgi:hypothetical protein
MKKLTTTLLLLSIVVFLSACGEGKINQSDNNSTMPIGQAAARNNGGDADSFISKDYRDKNELYGFIKTFLDYKEPAMEALEARKNDFTDTVSGLAGGDWAIDIPIDPLKRLLTLEKSGSSWEGEVIAFGYEIEKSGDVYAFKFTHTMLDKVMEGTCNIKTGVLQLVVEGYGTTQKYQIKALGSGAYLRFWSEKSDVLEETRAHYTYFRGRDIAVGQEETISPKELLSSAHIDDKYVENDEAWLKLINRRTSDFDGINN